MTPEQEDAHWALMGKPLMRHWLARLSELRRADRMIDAAADLQRKRRAIFFEADRIRQAADNVWWAAIPDNTIIGRNAATGSWTIEGVEYKLTDGTDYQLSQGE